jgi:hypothetical protein
MSMPKSAARRQKLLKKRQRKQSRLRHRQERAAHRAGDFLPSHEDAHDDLEPRFWPVDLPPARRVKMSAVLEDFAEPYADMTGNIDEYRELLAVAVVAWNAALESPARQRELIDDVLDEVLAGENERFREMCKRIAAELVERKRRSFAAYNRPILGFQVEDRGDQYYLQVV